MAILHIAIRQGSRRVLQQGIDNHPGLVEIQILMLRAKLAAQGGPSAVAADGEAGGHLPTAGHGQPHPSAVLGKAIHRLSLAHIKAAAM